MSNSNTGNLSHLPQPTTVSNVVPRSPSRDSFATDLSLMSLSSLGSEVSRMRSGLMRNPRNGEGPDESPRQSPQPAEMLWGRSGVRSSRGARGCLLQVPSEKHRPVTKRTISGEVLFEEETEAIRNCGALSSLLGLMKSFSTTDITHITPEENESLRPSTSEVALCDWGQFVFSSRRLDPNSRSLSTWVAVGDVASSSYVASPQPQLSFVGDAYPIINPAEMIRSVNKKVRQKYIRRRVLSTYKALERLTHSDINLLKKSQQQDTTTGVPQVQISTDIDHCVPSEVHIPSFGIRGPNKNVTLTVKDIDREKGRPLTNYERNMMIFSWLQNLEENSFEVS
ncbi:uncharacterized protein LOC143257372 [Tachypleus tridentatus]|uniref:uncharacterized protein LOC143257372 n=1 Tax=Tachypleus tridentatus TaxID=6853 RepID=UPI003FD3DB4A